MTQRGLGTAVALAFLMFFVPERAHALQPLEAFIRSGRTKSPDNAEARANLSQQQGVADATLGRVLPGISARGNYLRNQYQSRIDIGVPPAPPQLITIQPFNQLTGSATLTVPLIDLAGFVRTAAQ